MCLAYYFIKSIGFRKVGIMFDKIENMTRIIIVKIKTVNLRIIVAQFLDFFLNKRCIIVVKCITIWIHSLLYFKMNINDTVSLQCLAWQRCYKEKKTFGLKSFVFKYAPSSIKCHPRISAVLD